MVSVFFLKPQAPFDKRAGMNGNPAVSREVNPIFFLDLSQAVLYSAALARQRAE